MNAMVDRCIKVHAQATRDGSGMDPRAFARYTSLVAGLHASYAGLDLGAALADDDDDEQQGMDVDHPPGTRTGSRSRRYQDLLSSTTGLRGGPIVDQDGTYSLQSLPRIERSGTDAAAAELEAIIGQTAAREALREAYSRVAYDMAEVSRRRAEQTDMGWQSDMYSTLCAESDDMDPTPPVRNGVLPWRTEQHGTSRRSGATVPGATARSARPTCANLTAALYVCQQRPTVKRVRRNHDRRQQSGCRGQGDVS